ncbi:hypothetical protein MOK15_21290 [Sphingobium sp. BYY-5]|uniref:hypothetical protein n=1 Tax=Sphingobium sp. BYY-5 TaxID=2926400 RepID=UPI001FA6D58B|nr:hypothetical protein [Sphingobium sp. BYY-5]MCI4592595.1 hypothetical protein [Sphingobium sp. BYY-5]
MKDILRATRWHFSAEDKILIVLEGWRGDDGINGAIDFLDRGHRLFLSECFRHKRNSFRPSIGCAERCKSAFSISSATYYITRSSSSPQEN